MRAARISFPPAQSEFYNRRALPIEDLLVWAYADQMVHLAQEVPVELGGSNGPLAAYSSLWSEGSPVDGGSAQKRFDAAPDAWRVHREVVRLGRVEIDCGQDLAAARYHALGQYRGAAPPMTRAATVDKTAMAWPTDGVMKLEVPTLVILNALKARRPKIITAPDVRFKRGEVVRKAGGKGGVYSRGLFHHVSIEGTPYGEVLEAWHTYRVWREALDKLRRRIRSMSLLCYSVTNDLPPTLKKPRAWA